MFPTRVTGFQVLRPSSAVFPWVLAGSWFGRAVAGNQNCAKIAPVADANRGLSSEHNAEPIFDFFQRSSIFKFLQLL